MSSMTAADVHRFVVQHYRNRLGGDGGNIQKDTDLLQSGVIDSFGILELVQALESHFHVHIDLESLPPEELTVVGPLCAYVAANAVPTPRSEGPNGPQKTSG